MKKIKFLMMAIVAICATAFLAACSDDDDNPNNVTRYQNAVNKTVAQSKKHDKAILLVAFGSTWEQAYNAFDNTVKAYQEQFTDYDVYLSFSSAICINRAAAGEHVQPRNFYAPNYWLTAFAQKGVQYKEIVVQSLQVIPGEEYTRVINYIKDFANNNNGDLDDSYLSHVVLRLGTPLLQDAQEDVPEVAKQLNALYADKVAGKNYVLFMGHGNPDSYDTYTANVRYTELEAALQQYNSHYFVGTVDMKKNFVNNVYDRMQTAGFTPDVNSKVYCHPLMSIDGDHGHNDMAGNDTPEGASSFADLEINEEGKADDISWKKYFEWAGYTCDNSTMIEKGLLELPTIRNIWMSHTKNVIDNDERLDYYHSKNPED